MKMKRTGLVGLLLIVAALQVSCVNQKEKLIETLLNTAHLDHLYEEITIEGEVLGIIHIYAEYPDYHWIGDPSEGIACVDDAARAAIFYIRYADRYNNHKARQKAGRLLDFLLHMQADNGYFYNFIWDDYTIHKYYTRSEAKGDWWSYRALWALTEAVQSGDMFEPDLVARIDSALIRGLRNVLEQKQVSRDTIDFSGIPCPNWLPYGAAADLAGLLLLSLVPYYQSHGSKICFDRISDLAEGILLMQQKSDSFPYGAFLSWQNKWHAWGNIQSYSLIKTAAIADFSGYAVPALTEIDHFYTWMNRDTLLASFELAKDEQVVKILDKMHYSQIAYAIRPIVYSCIAAYEWSGDETYARLAADYAAWLFGRNPARMIMYNPHTGRCFDGINAPDQVNKNSGAESTIEALLVLQAIENCPPAQSHLNDYILRNIRKWPVKQ